MSETQSKVSPPADSQSPGDDYRLTASFPYLVRRVGLRIGELFDRAVEPFGVDVSMYRVMAALAEQNDQQLGHLAGITTIELSTLSRLVGTMVAKGLLTRKRPRDNGRIVEIALSAKGRRLTNELIPIAEHFEAITVQGLSGAEVQRIKSQLTAAYRNLDKLEGELAARDPAKPPRTAKRRAAPVKSRLEA